MYKIDDELKKYQKLIDRYNEQHPLERFDNTNNGTLIPLCDVTSGLKPSPNTPDDLLTDTPKCTRLFAKRDIMNFTLGLWKFRMDKVYLIKL